MVIVRDEPQGTLLPTLGLWTVVFLIAGSMIGSGIFRLPGPMMAQVQNPAILLLVWVVGGLFTICGALTFAELAGMFPRTGGQYVFLRESMGKRWAFLYGWTFFWVVMTGIIASVAVVFAEFNQEVFGFGNEWIPVIAVGCIVALSVVNYIGVKFGGVVNNVFTVAKISALLALIILGFTIGDPSHSTFNQTVADAPGGGALFVAFILAMISAFFALDGWPQAAYVAAEIKEPTKNVPRAMVIGVLTVSTIYVLATAVYLYLVDAGRMVAIGDANSGQRIATEAARVFGGDTGATALALAVIVSTFGTVNAYILTSPRIYYALAKDRLFWHPFSKIHPTNNTPHVAILYQGIWAGLLVTLGSIANDAYIALTTAVVYGLWLFYIPTIVGYFKLRHDRPDHPRPYRTHFYPYVPLLFLLAALLVVGVVLGTNIYDLFTKDLSASDIAGLAGIWGTVLILTGLPVIISWNIKERRGESTPVSED